MLRVMHGKGARKQSVVQFSRSLLYNQRFGLYLRVSCKSYPILTYFSSNIFLSGSWCIEWDSMFLPPSNTQMQIHSRLSPRCISWSFLQVFVAISCLGIAGTWLCPVLRWWPVRSATAWICEIHLSNTSEPHSLSVVLNAGDLSW